MKHEIKPSKALILVLLAGLLLSACGTITIAKAAKNTPVLQSTATSNVSLVSEAHLVPRDYKYLSFATGGKISEILVKKGDPVTEGQVLARLGERAQAEAAVASADLEKVSAQQAYDELQRTVNIVRAVNLKTLINAKETLNTTQSAWDALDTDEYQKKIDDATTEVNNKKDDLKTAQDDYDKYKDLSVDNPDRKLYQDKLDQAQKAYDEAVRKLTTLIDARDLAKADYDKAQADVIEAQRKFDAVQNGPDPDQLSLTEARLANANAQLTAAQAALDNLELKAPFTGKVVDINVVSNEQVGPNNWAILVADESAWYVETDDLTELDVVKVALDQKATIVADALPDVEMTGKVTEISDVFSQKGGDITYKVRILLETGAGGAIDPRLRWGMTVEVTFPAGTQP